MMWKVLYLAFFLSGLALAVHAMLHGMERWRRHRSAKPSAALNPPTVAALAIGFGASGYLLLTRSSLGPSAVLLVSLLIGAAALSGMIVLMAKWALRHGVSISQDDEDVSGQVAVVTRTITTDEPGEISWFAWNRQHILPAQSLDGSEIPAGTEVVIDAVERGVAYVELWSVVETRL
jgi:hypothetical protein